MLYAKLGKLEWATRMKPKTKLGFEMMMKDRDEELELPSQVEAEKEG